METSPEISKVASYDIEKVLLGGDLSKLTPDHRLSYYNQVCTSLGLNPLTKPFEYIQLNGKLQLYARKDCTDQLRSNRGVSVDNLTHDFKEALGLYIVTANGSLPNGRKDTGTGAVSVKNVTGDNLANAIMKAETKAKRRLTLSICGLGMLDESELDTIKGAKQPSHVEPRIVSGEVLEMKVFEQAGVSIVKIGDEKFTIKALDLDKLMANSKGKDVELECAEEYGPKGKYWVVNKVLRIGNYDFRDTSTLEPQLEYSLDASREMEVLDALDGKFELTQAPVKGKQVDFNPPFRDAQ